MNPNEDYLNLAQIIKEDINKKDVTFLTKEQIAKKGIEFIECLAQHVPEKKEEQKQ